jgi:hypothetical protein
MGVRITLLILGVVLLLAVPPLTPMPSSPVASGPPKPSGSSESPPVTASARFLNSTGASSPSQGWTHLVGVTGPTRRTEYAFAFDPAMGGIVLFGGWNGKAYLGDTWLFHNGSWTDLGVTGPPARARAVMAFDNALGTMVLFGGYDGATYRADTWGLNGSGWARLKLGSTTNPPGRASSAMVFDPAERSLVLVGGTNGAALGDVWTLRGLNWTAFPRAVSPSNRSAPALGYDLGSGQLILFGGASNVSRFLGDTWRLENGTWSLLANVTTPSPRSDAAFGYDPVDGGLVLFGGTNGTLLSDTWSLRNGNWTRWHPPVSPPASDGGRLVADPWEGALVLFGGWTGSAPLNETWTFRAGPATLAWQSANSGADPWSRSNAAMAYDEATGGILLFGGENPFPSNPSNAYFGDTWVYSLGQWSLLSSPVSPRARSGAGAAFDASLGGVVLFGGWNGSVEFNDSWLFRGGTWSELFPSPAPSARSFAGFASDPADHGLLLFGGETRSGSAGPITRLQDTWEFHDGRWNQLPLTPAVPTARSSPQLAFSPASGEMILFGGLAATVSGGTFSLNDTWRFRGGVWENRTVLVGATPTARWGGDLVFDPGAAALVLLGGTGALGRSTDMWAFRGGAWTGICRACDPTSPSTEPAVFDPGLGALVALSGYRLTIGDPFGRFSATQAWAPTPFVLATTEPAAGTDVNISAKMIAWWGGGLPPQSISWVLPNGSLRTGDGAPIGSTVSGEFNFTALLTTGGNRTASGLGTLWVHLWPQIRLRPLAYSVTVHAPLYIGVNVTGGTPPMTAQYQNLPLGCASPVGLNLSCRPAGVGAFAIDVTLTDGAGANTTRYVQVNVTGPHPPPGPSQLSRWATVGVLGGIVLVVVAGLWYRRRERMRRAARLAARRRALEIAGLPPGSSRSPPPASGRRE